MARTKKVARLTTGGLMIKKIVKRKSTQVRYKVAGKVLKFDNKSSFLKSSINSESDNTSSSDDEEDGEHVQKCTTINVFVTHRDHPVKVFEWNFEFPFKCFIEDQMNQISQENCSLMEEGIQISKMAREDGFLAVSCHNDETIKWLKERVPLFKVPGQVVEGEFTVCMEKLDPKLRNGFWFNFDLYDVDDVVGFPRRFKIANLAKFKDQPANADEWKFVKKVDRKLIDGQDGESLLYDVDQASVDLLNSSNKWFGGCSVITVLSVTPAILNTRTTIAK